MAEFTFLSLSEVLEIHHDQVARYGGTPGVRNLELLKRAVGMPAATFGGEYLHTDIYQRAAAYLFHLVKNHPFVDGNKRAGAVSALVYLALNGYDFAAPQAKLAEFVISVANGKRDKADVAVFIRKWAVKL